jgi:hypothetical protein
MAARPNRAWSSSSNHVRDGRERIVGVEHHVRERDREVADGVAVHHVAEVDDAARTVAVDEHVVVVQIGVDRASRQLAQNRHHVPLVTLGQHVDRATEGCVVYERPILAHDAARVRQVPVKVTVNRRMIEVRERRA